MTTKTEACCPLCSTPWRYTTRIQRQRAIRVVALAFAAGFVVARLVR